MLLLFADFGRFLSPRPGESKKWGRNIAAGNVARHRGDSQSHLSLNRRAFAHFFVAWAQKRDLVLRYITHIANSHV